MKPSRKFLATSSSLAAGLLLWGVGHAQTQSQPNPFSQVLMTSCPKMIEQLVGRPEFASALSPKPIDVSSVCNCTNAAFNSDSRLQAVFSLPSAQLQEKMAASHVRSYLLARLTHSVLSCLAPELEASLLATTPLQ
jgi:hypothetical protein